MPPDRRARRRQETIEEILDLAVDVMAEVGVNGLSLAEVARRLGVQPPSLYKYFPSLMAVYDALFQRGQQQFLQEVRAAIAGATPGFDALTAGMEAGLRWTLANPAVGQLMFWRPVPSFEPSEEAFAPSIEWVGLLHSEMSHAVAAGQLGPGGDSEEAVNLLSVVASGVITQTAANEPGATWDTGRYTALFPLLMRMFADAYPSAPERATAKPRARR